MSESIPETRSKPLGLLRLQVTSSRTASSRQARSANPTPARRPTSKHCRPNTGVGKDSHRRDLDFSGLNLGRIPNVPKQAIPRTYSRSLTKLGPSKPPASLLPSETWSLRSERLGGLKREGTFKRQFECARRIAYAGKAPPNGSIPQDLRRSATKPRAPSPRISAEDGSGTTETVVTLSQPT